MRKIVRLLGVLALVALAACASPNVSQQLDSTAAGSASLLQAPTVNVQPDILEGRYIIVLESNATAADRAALAAQLETAPTHYYNTVYIGFAGELTPSEVVSITADARVAYVEPDELLYLHQYQILPGGGGAQIVPPLTNYDRGYIDDGSWAHPFASPQQVDWGVQRIGAYPSPGLKGLGITVAIIDTGIDVDHADLQNPDGSSAIVAEYDAINDVSGAGVADDGGGHGTHVAGIVAARDYDAGPPVQDNDTVGMAPEASLAGIKVFPDPTPLNPNPGAAMSDIIRGIDWIAANWSVVTPNIRVANMSLGGPGHSQAQRDAIEACKVLGIVYAVSAGNEYRDATGYKPARYDNVICVSALTNGDTFSVYSNFGAVVDVIAPGTSILSLQMGGDTTYKSGTSMASPHVAGAIALWLDENPGDGFDEVLAALLATGEAGPWPLDPDGYIEPLVDVSTF